MGLISSIAAWSLASGILLFFPSFDGAEDRLGALLELEAGHEAGRGLLADKINSVVERIGLDAADDGLCSESRFSAFSNKSVGHCGFADGIEPLFRRDELHWVFFDVAVLSWFSSLPYAVLHSYPWKVAAWC